MDPSKILPIAKAIHIIGFTCWFAGLFYLVRLFIYNTEAKARGDDSMVKQFGIMQKRLLYGITVPAMIVTVVFGIWLLDISTSHFKVFDPWLHLKLFLVVLLIGYHHVCVAIHKKLTKGTCTWTSRKLRVLNEIATVFLVAIVFWAVTKSYVQTGAALGVLGVLLFLGFVVFGKKGADK